MVSLAAMTIRKVIQWLAIAVAAFVVIAIVYLSVADLTWLKPRIESAVTEATGREFSIDGEFSLRALWSPTFVIEQARLANADWGSQPTMLEIGHASGRVDLWSLISGPMLVEELRVRDVDLLLETHEDGTSNLQFETAEGAAEPPVAEPSDQAEVPLIIELAEIRNVQLTRIVAGKAAHEASVEALDIVTDDQQWLAIEGNGGVNDLAFNVAGRVGSISALQRGRDIGLDLEGGLGRLQLTIAGTIATLEAVAGSDLDMLITADDVAPILERLAIDLPLEGALRAKLEISPEDTGTRVSFDASAGEFVASGNGLFSGKDTIEFEVDVPALERAGKSLGMESLPAGDLALNGKAAIQRHAIEFDPLTAQLGESRFVVTGSVSRERGKPHQLSIDADVASLASLREGLPPLAVDATAGVSVAAGRLTIDPLDAKLADSDVQGTIAVETGERPSLQARLTSQRVDLTPLLGEPEEGSAAASDTANKPRSKRVFSKEPLPFDRLNKMNVDIVYAIGRLVHRDAEISDVRTTAQLHDGELEYRTKATGSEGGTWIAQIGMMSAGDSADVKAQIFMRDLKLNLFSGENAKPEQIPPIDVTLDVRANGASPHALAASTNGRLLVTQGPGRVENNALGKLSGDLVAQIFSALNPFAKDEKYSNWECSVFAVQIANGDAAIGGMLAQGEKVKIVGGGSIDLESEKLNIEFNTKPRKGVGVSADMFVTPFVALTGTLSEPRVGLNKKGALLSGGAAVLTGGLSLLVKGGLDRITGGVDSCEKLLEEVGGHPPLPD